MFKNYYSKGQKTHVKYQNENLNTAESMKIFFDDKFIIEEYGYLKEKDQYHQFKNSRIFSFIIFFLIKLQKVRPPPLFGLDGVKRKRDTCLVF